MRLKGYVFDNVGELTNDPKLEVVHGFICHVTGTMVSPKNYFDGPSKGIESHLYIPRTRDNPKEQYRDTTREADANYRANSWIGKDGKRHGFISCETQGLGGGEWTDYQILQIKDAILQTQREHKYPFKVPGNYHGYGVGYHTLFPEWSNVPGKTCPGVNRKVQFKEIIVPWLNKQAEEDKIKFYTTKRGDTVPVIADKFNIPQWQLWRWNPHVNPPFDVGTKLRVG
jgi:LysM repeat protein